MRREQRNTHHLATISHDGHFWDAYLEIEEPASHDAPARGRIAFSAADAGDVEPARTTTIFIEETGQQVVARARDFKTHQLVALLRSCLPPDEDEAGDEDTAAADRTEREPGADEGEEPGLP